MPPTDAHNVTDWTLERPTLAFGSIPAGILRMPVWRFLYYTFIGTLPWALGTLWAGRALGDRFPMLVEWVKPFLLPVLAVLGGIALVWAVTKGLMRRAVGAAGVDREVE